MADDPDADVRELADRILSGLLTARERERDDVGVVVERRRVGAAWSETARSGTADLFSVSIGWPGSSREVWVDVDRGPDRAAGMAEAARVVADAFQDEVVGLLREARPACRGHAHPMLVDVEGTTAFWRCPSDPAMRVTIWP